MIPERTNMRFSNSGQVSMNFPDIGRPYMKPITRSTPARLYQLAVKQNHLARGRKVRDGALKVPLRFFPLCRRAQRYDFTDARIERFSNAFDGAAFSRRIAAFKQDNHFQMLRDESTPGV